LISGQPVREDVARTGEVTLTGQVLPIGGLKEKALAAQRNGITTIIAPSLNAPDVEEIPAPLRADLQFVFVTVVDEVLEAALEPVNGKVVPARRRGRERLSSPERRAARSRR
jgi:ATP-dependent Lon protease